MSWVPTPIFDGLCEEMGLTPAQPEDNEMWSEDAKSAMTPSVDVRLPRAPWPMDLHEVKNESELE